MKGVIELLFFFLFFYAGLALLKFRERVVNDPLGALSNWNDHKEDINPCFWLGVECSDGKVVALYVLSPDLNMMIIF